MRLKDDYLNDWYNFENSIRDKHNFYLIFFVYIVMNGYLHYIDLKDGSYDWAYYSLILMSFSMIWMVILTFSFSFKSKMIVREMEKRQLNSILKNQNHGNK